MIRALIAANNNRTNHQHREGTRVRNSSSGAHQLRALSTERAELQRNNYLCCMITAGNSSLVRNKNLVLRIKWISDPVLRHLCIFWLPTQQVNNNRIKQIYEAYLSRFYTNNTRWLAFQLSLQYFLRSRLISRLFCSKVLSEARLNPPIFSSKSISVKLSQDNNNNNTPPEAILTNVQPIHAHFPTNRSTLLFLLLTTSIQIQSPVP